MPETAAPITERSPTSRSRVTNGKTLLPGVDGRSREARRYRDILYALAAERGGIDACTESERALMRQVAALQSRSEAMHAAQARGEPYDPEQETRLANALTRAVNALGRLRRHEPAGKRNPVTDYLSGAAA